MPRLLDFDAICETGVAKNWTTLNRRIQKEGFPPGRLIGRKRFWNEADFLAWLESRPVGKAPLRVWAKKNHHAGAA